MSAIKPARSSDPSNMMLLPRPVFGTPGVVSGSVTGGTGVEPAAETMSVPEVEAGRPFGPYAPAAIPIGVIDNPVAAFFATTLPGITEIE